jgi:hypothetical protein
MPVERIAVLVEVEVGRRQQVRIAVMPGENRRRVPSWRDDVAIGTVQRIQATLEVLIFGLFEHAFEAWPAEVLAAVHDVDFFPRSPADVAEVHRVRLSETRIWRSRIGLQRETIGIAEAVRPDARRVARGIAVEERVRRIAVSRLRIDAQQLA